MFPGSEIAAALRCGPDEAAIDIAGAVLFATRERSVFVPRHDRARQAYALGFFSTNARRRIVGALQLQAWRWTGVGLRTARLSLPAQWRDRFDANLAAASLYSGSPGPLQKISVLLPPRLENGIAHLVKVALRPTADDTIAREAHCLLGLARAGADVRRHVPELVADGMLASGRRYLVTTVIGGRRGSAQLHDEYMRFLQSLAEATQADTEWQQGEALRHTRQCLRQLDADAIPNDMRESLEDCLNLTAEQLHGKRIPHTLMHGDFTRFNICHDERGFVVFDWEYSRSQCNPIADVLHYTLSRRMILSARWAMHDAIADAARFSELAFVAWRPSRRDLAALALHALVDTIALYATADGHLNTRSFLVRRYLGLINSRRSWMYT